MNGPPTSPGGESTEWLDDALRERYARIARTDEEYLAADLLAHTPTHDGRDRDQLRTWAARALAFGREMANSADSADPEHPEAAAEISERATGGLRPGEVVLAEYRHTAARGLVVVYGDALDLAHRVARAAGWGADFTRASVREAAVAHEEAHRILHTGRWRALHRTIDHTALRLGPLRVRGHVVGVGEIAAHSFARHRCSLRRSPLALNAAIAATLTRRDSDRPGTNPRNTGDHP